MQNPVNRNPDTVLVTESAAGQRISSWRYFRKSDYFNPRILQKDVGSAPQGVEFKIAEPGKLNRAQKNDDRAQNAKSSLNLTRFYEEFSQTHDFARVVRGLAWSIAKTAETTRMICLTS